jgi:hypothetical protein
VAIGDPIAQAILVPRTLRRPALECAAEHDPASLAARERLDEWDRWHAEDRSAYKRLARSAHGRTETQLSPTTTEKE